MNVRHRISSHPEWKEKKKKPKWKTKISLYGIQRNVHAHTKQEKGFFSSSLSEKRKKGVDAHHLRFIRRVWIPIHTHKVSTTYSPYWEYSNIYEKTNSWKLFCMCFAGSVDGFVEHV